MYGWKHYTPLDWVLIIAALTAGLIILHYCGVI